MFGLGPATRIYLAAGVTGMRKGFEGLYGLVRDRLSCEPLSGHLFLFCDGQRNRLKVLVWDGSGLWVCANRHGRQQVLQSHAAASAEHDSGKGPGLGDQPRNAGRVGAQSRRVADPDGRRDEARIGQRKLHSGG